MSDWYILDENRNPVRCDDHVKRHEWKLRLPEEERTGIGCIVAVTDDIPGVRVSTVFLGLDHRWQMDQDPQVFETMLFCDGDYNNYCERYSTWDQAEQGHAEIVSRVKNGDMASATLSERNSDE